MDYRRRKKMPRPKSKIRQAEETINDLKGQVKKLLVVISGMKVNELEMEIAYRNEQLKFATHKINDARAKFSKALLEAKDENVNL